MVSKKGAIACGHPATAEAAKEILEEGGNAFDAVIAAFAAANVAEPVLTSLGGGGFLLAHRSDHPPLLYDFFAQTPQQPHESKPVDFFPIHADFGTTTQQFHIGLGAMAAPGSIKGMFQAHRDLGSLPMTRLFEPAINLARNGVTLRSEDAYLFQVVGPILQASPEARALYCRPDGSLLAAGDRMVQPDQADTLEALAREGEALLYQGELAKRLIDLCRAEGGLLTTDDLASYQVIRRSPLRHSYRGTDILTNPPPSSGGILITFALELLQSLDLNESEQRDESYFALLGRIMALTNQARVECCLHDLVANEEGPDAAEVLFERQLLERYRDLVLPHRKSNRGTTHISVLDAEGNMAALTLSNGEGCGRILPGTGIMLNNMLGEEDLSPRGLTHWDPGKRMSSMMSPTIALLPSGAMVALGSGGSNRIRTAILQVLLNILEFRFDLATAVAAPRIHFEAGRLNMEAGIPEKVPSLLADIVEEVIPWPGSNLFFGGVHAVARSRDGAFSAAGDKRRGGAALTL